jgi:hypothetical protein
MIDLSKIIPGFNDQATRKKLIRQIDDYVISIGFSQKEADAINDPQIILLAYRAMMAHNSKGEKISKGKPRGLLEM